MELLNWFKKPVKWWAGLALIVVGMPLVRGVEGCENCKLFGAIIIFTGLAMVMLFGKVDSSKNDSTLSQDDEEFKDGTDDHSKSGGPKA
ncbi:hypothetical protein HF888_14255 [Bermanella marisrubri]|uniref:Uncharacterized protein n=1 Tax=Bermanella marisrubri TaxID=207949 RepID=Q1MZH0_9GAMM|nr:hypothetical protein [Bermanella marisrubri]EAT11296.1 hypothetical protein RED65_12752 [Oceanobacter sp. RED65] [Bermanella marisrubri]QIZ85314.1 hypothetical protein HF888_14255 [Bermanella marisrubri]